MAPANDAEFAQAIYDAFLKAALAMSDEQLKSMSWFGRNWRTCNSLWNRAEKETHKICGSRIFYASSIPHLEGGR